ncbi:MAG: hypothetical protein WB762_12440 [Candidatus Sulfotelmatobacter sp.]
MGATGSTPLSPPHAIQFAGPEDARLFFSGPPRALIGTIPLVNSGTDKQKIRSVAVSAGDLLGATGLPLREFSFYAKLGPGEQANISGRIMLDGKTPPGPYDIKITVGSRTLPATVYVTEVVDLRIQPQQITILAGSSSSYTRKLIVENQGNVALPLGAQCEVPLFEPLDLTSSMLIGLHKADKASAESMVKGFLREWSDLQVGTLLINREPKVLRPGEKGAGDVEFQLPPDLKPIRRYHANLELFNATLRLDIYTAGKVGSARKRKSDQR